MLSGTPVGFALRKKCLPAAGVIFRASQTLSDVCGMLTACEQLAGERFIRRPESIGMCAEADPVHDLLDHHFLNVG